MDPTISARITESVFKKIAGLYGIKPKQLSFLGGFDSLVFTFERSERRYVLRILQDPRRQKSLVRGELDWVQHLIRNGVPAMRPILSDMGNLIEIVPDSHGGNFLCVAFERAQGGEIRKAHLGESLFRNYGRLLGSMHAATKSYIPRDPTWRRPAWDSPGAISAEIEMPLGQEDVMEKYHKLKDRLSRLPREPESFGLIHTDVHIGNLSITEDLKLSVFDFAECCYGHFIYDIAMVFFYAVSAFDDPVEFMGRFHANFSGSLSRSQSN